MMPRKVLKKTLLVKEKILVDLKFKLEFGLIHLLILISNGRQEKRASIGGPWLLDGEKLEFLIVRNCLT